MTPRALIVGAGIAGLALARALRQRGITAEIVERTAEWETGGTGMYLPGNSVRALDELGIWDGVAGSANPIERQRFLDHRGRLLVDIDVRSYWEGVGGSVAIPRAALHSALRTGVAGREVRLGILVTGLDDAVSRARVHFSDGSSSDYDLVVGADGVHSTIRKLAFGSSPARYVGQASWRFIAEGFPEIRGWTVMLGRGRAFLTVALGNGSVYCYGDVNTTDPQMLAARLGANRSPSSPTRYRAYSSTPARRSSRQSRKRAADLDGRARRARRRTRPRQPRLIWPGAATALEHALALADVLATTSPLEQALAEIQRRRTSRVAWVQESFIVGPHAEHALDRPPT